MTSTPNAVAIPARGSDLPAQLFAPTAGAARAPGLVVLHDIFGLDEWTQQAAARLAGCGYVTLAPDLHARSGGPKDAASQAALCDFAASLHDNHLIQDTLAALDWLAAQAQVDATRLGVLGWGWGGAYALLAAAHAAHVSAVVDIAGAITYPLLTAQQPGSPLNFIADIEGTIFAAFPGSDPLIPMNEIERLRGRLGEHAKRGEIKVYADAPPRFWRDDALPQTALLWRRLENFLRDNLLAPGASEEPPGDDPNEASRLQA